MIAIIAGAFMFINKANAQEVYELKNLSVQDSHCYAYASETVRVEISPLSYKLMENEGVENFCFVAVVDNEGSVFNTIIRKDDLKIAVFEVESVGMTEDGTPRVFFVGGQYLTYNDESLFTLNPGQKLRMVNLYKGINNEGRLIQTVSRDTPTTEGFQNYFM